MEKTGTAGHSRAAVAESRSPSPIPAILPRIKPGTD